jgi:hypothetical protein
LIGEALAMDLTRAELKDVFERKLSQWKEQKGAVRNDE